MVGWEGGKENCGLMKFWRTEYQRAERTCRERDKLPKLLERQSRLLFCCEGIIRAGVKSIN